MNPTEYDLITAARPLLTALPAVAVLLFAGGAVGDTMRRDLARRRKLRAARGLPAARPAFEASASWWVDRHGVRPVRRHRARRAWTAGRAAPVRRLVRRAVIAAAAAVDLLTLPGRAVTA